MKESSKSESREGRNIVVVVYEDATVREHAARFCARLAEEFGFSAGSEVNWWSFSLLGQPVAGRDAARKAAVADMIIFATGAEGDLPQQIKLWLEEWLGKRGEREGALVSLMERGDRVLVDLPPFKEIYLRNIAHRAGMDFLSHEPQIISKAMPDSLDSFNDRAGCMTSTLSEILHAHPHTSPLPLL